MTSSPTSPPTRVVSRSSLRLPPKRRNRVWKQSVRVSSGDQPSTPPRPRVPPWVTRRKGRRGCRAITHRAFLLTVASRVLREPLRTTRCRDLHALLRIIRCRDLPEPLRTTRCRDLHVFLRIIRCRDLPEPPLTTRCKDLLGTLATTLSRALRDRPRMLRSADRQEPLPTPSTVLREPLRIPRSTGLHALPRTPLFTLLPMGMRRSSAPTLRDLQRTRFIIPHGPHLPTKR